MQTRTVNCRLQCVWNQHAGCSSFRFTRDKKKANKGRTWACCSKRVHEQTEQLRAEHREEFPLRLGSLNDRSSREDGCQDGLWAQLANKRPGPLLGAGPALVDSPTNAAGAAFNLLPSSLLSLTSLLNSSVCPSWGFWRLFCMYLQRTALHRPACEGRKGGSTWLLYAHTKGHIS